ncbi:unnamed protein product [Zymoseptoria tritici ST99CH_1E4]|uniref:Uncharacterized protein n=3 Tax=Zymoseptoria tritici TaxID=1047171 RepID=F9X8M4_ZYMTI|nr:uncharacterized protein MYCGRDRAFT_92845 [Zymoseptoria tritici IPO323]EGP88216.1 hypothetical protein MYCGRDRAFT_92845 [Zymoseptoria tritici IPO323]SMR51285.1 unnamed protein product [Zymoseptoria tritici ST99CH_1E4]
MSAVTADLDYLLANPMGLEIMLRMGWEPDQTSSPKSSPSATSSAVQGAKTSSGDQKNLPTDGDQLDSIPDISSLNLKTGAGPDQSNGEQAGTLSRKEQIEMLKTYKDCIGMLMEYYNARSTSVIAPAPPGDVDPSAAEEDKRKTGKAKLDVAKELALDEVRPGPKTLTGFTNWLSDLRDAHIRAAPGNTEETFRKRALGSWQDEKTARLDLIQENVEAYTKSRALPGFEDAEPPLFKNERSMRDYMGMDKPPVFAEDEAVLEDDEEDSDD